MKSTLQKPDYQNPKNVYHIGGIPVEFPYQPYGTQLAFMGRVISTLDRAQREGHCHALLESPTGTGKSLSLLCSALAWQMHRGSKGVRSNGSQSRADPRAALDPLNHGGGFVPESQPPRVLATEQAATTNGKIQKKKAVPTIFYASRTHSQISQVIREYRKTAYRVPMAVLASRKHYCTNARVRSVENLDEECKRLLDNRENGCPHFKNASRVKSHPSLQKGGCHEAHDIEDLVKVGNIVKGCSYFAARSMADDAQLVFCPYGYIINPVIRRAMDVDIKGAVLILDEAHNIEDIAREAGSIDVDEEGLERLQTELGQLCAGDAMTYQPLYEMVQDMLSWMERQKNALEKREFQHYCTCWTGDKAVRELQEASISQQCFPALQECAVKAIKAASDTESGLAHLSGMSAVILEGLFCSLNYFFHGNGAHIHDYQLSLQRFVKKDAVNPAGYWTLTFSLWCLNPAVTFRDIADLSLSVILTSGTLTPTNSFSSELGVQFETCLEAPHVIDVESQVWVSVIPTGPRNYPLNASYKTADGYAFQDALGKSLEEICKVVPGGALVFFPSYKLLDKLYSRWHETGQWSRLNARKPFFVEPRGGNQDDFESVLKGYYDSIRRGHRPTFGRRRKGKKMEANGCSPIDSIDSPNKGAAFLAVCRGKVSEGIDFSDDNARVVIIVGIPFPNINDIQVAQKKKYNDTYKHSKNLLSGSEWYCHQAFRALNQAAGRCIRHRFDYGAIILLDERFREERNVMYISKWLRKSIRQYKNFETSVEELKSFFCNIKERVGTASSLHGSGNTSETMMMPPNDCGKGEGTLRKSQKLRKPLGREEEMNLDNTMAIAGQSDRLPLNVEDDTFIQESSQGNTDVLLASPMNSKDIGCCPGTHQECSFVDLRCSEVPFTATSDEGLELTIVKETPATLGNCLIGSPESISKGENSSSTIVQTSFENPGQGMLYSPSLRNSARSPSELTCSLVVTPERDVSTSNKELILEIESSLNLSVNSHAQKRRKSLNLPLIHLIEEDKFDLEAAKSTQETRATGNSMGNRHANHTNKLGPENMSPRHIINGTNIVQSSAISEDDKSCMSTSPPLDQQLQIFCSRCRNPLGRPENQLYVACSFTVSQKVILSHLLEEKSRTLPQTPSTQVSVLIVDVSSVVFLLSNKSSKDVPHQGIWCQEDGCVYNAVFCPFCPSPNNCLGVQVVATDASNFQLINKILFYYDRLEIRSQQVPESKVLHQDNGTHHIEIVDINSIDKYVYRSPQQSSGGWRTTKTKLRLPKRR